uniref:Helicase ATP-binding domain-containing protein n=1 Tax=Rhodosorus marinus TaxID=101924 RepID=A0A7S2ZHM4_9RHOD|mmetsp:Transcript_19852/g.79170  ORF Transcript_19852/g.79170 Transcript_19852/m.79170 type:complete len:622 (+) Transcript_19852:207-2072(+)
MAATVGFTHAGCVKRATGGHHGPSARVFRRRKGLVCMTSASTGSRVRKMSPDEDGRKMKIRARDFVVHEDYGVGKFLGTTVEDGEKYAVVQYRDGLLHIPIQDTKEALSFFKPGEVEPKPKLAMMENKTAWKRTVSKARMSAKSLALNLIKLYSTRDKLAREPYSEERELMNEFEAKWEYTPTEDQQTCISDVMEDMCGKSVPMDRLVCGDVGFGKTEVALRAAFLAVANKKQVVVLAPTTVLVTQHYKNFTQRMQGFGVTIGVHMRFVPDEQKKIFEESAVSGELDIIIGTHGVLSFGKKMPKVGLMIIDEEQRFGVQQKESFKGIRKQLDVLTLSATPIPRTMYMGISGVRDMSLMSTPPPLRKSVETSVVTSSDPIVEKTIQHELDRKGQVFIVTPRIKDLHRLSAWVEERFPESTTIVAHSKVGDLEAKMHKFATGQADMLLSTSIIESGIDIPRVNTLIVNRSDMFGLAQLYQLRGRVGRSNLQAFAVFMYNSSETIGATALRRLFAMEEFTELGSSFALAKRDLELRGAGALYGIEQSGTVTGVGVELYMTYLRESVTDWKIVERYTYCDDPQILLSKAYPTIPASFIPNDGERDAANSRILETQTFEELDQVRC